jgi:hypothetical protein
MLNRAFFEHALLLKLERAFPLCVFALQVLSRAILMAGHFCADVVAAALPRRL